jgi:hypothetical protein
VAQLARVVLTEAGLHFIGRFVFEIFTAEEPAPDNILGAAGSESVGMAPVLCTN